MKLFNQLSLACLFSLSLVLIASCDKQEQTPGQVKQSVCERTPDIPEKLRMDNYRAPTPECVPNAITIDTAEMVKLIQQSPNLILIDVLSVITRPNAEFGEGKWLPNKERFSLPGTVWLPNVGYGYLDEQMEHYFTSQLEALTQGDKTKPLVFFCIADCWMSWNSVQRARDYGYHNVYWYKNGTDGWAESGLEVQKTDPVPLTFKE